MSVVRMHRVFYVDDQEDIVWSTTRLLARQSPRLTVDGFTSPLDALQAIRACPPDILVTDLWMDEMSGLELMVEARRVAAKLPVIMVTGYSAQNTDATLRKRSSIEYLDKPVRTKSLIASINRVFERSELFSGDVSSPMLPDLVQIYALSQTTGTLKIRQPTQSGVICFDRGKMVHASSGSRFGESAVYELLSWHDCDFAPDTEPISSDRTVIASWQEVLTEGFRRIDQTGMAAMSAEETKTAYPSSHVAVPGTRRSRDVAADAASEAHSAPIPGYCVTTAGQGHNKEPPDVTRRSPRYSNDEGSWLIGRS